MTGLHVDSVRKIFGNRQVLNDIFLSCKQGEIIGLFGRNGSGKSTLLKIIFGSINSDHKYVSINGTKLNTLSDNMRFIRYLPQQSFLPGHVTIKQLINAFHPQNIALELSNHELVIPWLNCKAKELSGGELRILEVMLIMYSEAPYILLDEPFNGISPINLETIKDIIKLKSADKGIVISDHDYNNVLDVSTRNLLLHDGNTKAVAGIDDLIDAGYLPISVKLQ